jgi:hypothetical protein
MSTTITVESPERTLRRLFLTLFLRGRTARGLNKERAPSSVGGKLALTLGFYALFGCMALMYLREPVFVLAIYLHGFTLAFIGLTVASSAGEVLFNKEEGDILLHRPVTSAQLLRAKIVVLVEISLWLGCAFNLVGFFAGVGAKDGSWLFPPVHAISTAMEALFCTSCVVLAYELCLRWFGREKLEGLMTTVQIFVAIAAVAAGQLIPRLIGRFGTHLRLTPERWWMALLPPTWFAGFDDALAGSHLASSWLLAACGVGLTVGGMWLAFVKLARHYETGLQVLAETSAPRPAQNARRRWFAALVDAPPLRWWLRDPVTRAGFLLTAAYLFRDRETKLRMYPGIAPMLMMPVIFLFQAGSERGGFGPVFGAAFAAGYIGIVPLLGVSLLQYSQQWPASDIFRAAPMDGPARLCDGARRAVLCLLTLPMLLAFGVITWWVTPQVSHLLLMLPGIVALPIYAIIPQLGGGAIPLSMPAEEARAAGRGLRMMVAMLAASGLSGLVAWSWHAGWFHWLLLCETVLAAGLYAAMRASLRSTRWPAME